MPKFCRDCLHAEQTPADSPGSWRCKRPKFDLVSGNSQDGHNLCFIERVGRVSEHYCGEEAVFFDNGQPSVRPFLA